MVQKTGISIFFLEQCEHLNLSELFAISRCVNLQDDRRHDSTNVTGSDSEDSRSRVGGVDRKEAYVEKVQRQAQTWGWGRGYTERQKWKRRREQEMPVFRWEAWKPEGNLNRLWLPLRHDRLLIPIPSLLLSLTHTHTHIHTCIHKPAMHVGTQSYSKKIKQETLREHKCAGSCQKSVNCADAYIRKSSRFSKVSTTQQQKPWKAPWKDQLGAA